MHELHDYLVALARHCWTGAHWKVYPGQHPAHIKEPLKSRHIEDHLNNRCRIGLAPITPGTDTTRVALLDLDSHKGESTWAQMAQAAAAVTTCARAQGLEPIAFKSSGGKGIHLLFLWEGPQDAYSVRQTLAAVLAECDFANGVKGVRAREIEIFPKQDAVPLNGVGNMFVLPCAGESTPLDEAFEPADFNVLLGTTPPYSKPVARIDRTQKENDRSQTSNTPLPDRADAKELIDLINKIPNSGEHELDYDAWRNVIFAIHYETGGSDVGYAIAEEFSQRSGKHDAHFFETRVWPYIRDDKEKPVTIDTLRYLARQHEKPEDVLDDFEVLEDDAPAQISAPIAANDILVPGREFAKSQLQAPSYVWHHVLQRGCLYALTARWGHAKTALMIMLALHAAVGKALGGHDTEQTKVLYLCGENPDDVRLRVAAGLCEYDIDVDRALDNVVFTQRPFTIDKPKALKEFLAAATEHKPFGLVIIDTGPAHSAAQEENDNREMHTLAIAMRALIKPLGSPAVVALMHPSKDAQRSELQPRGGGAFSGSIDGELCAWAENGVVELFHRTKFRGPGFAPMFFELRTHTLPLTDNFGQDVVTVLTHEAQRETKVRGRRPKGDVQTLIWRTLNELCEIAGDGVAVDVLVAHVVDKLPLQEGKRDKRGQHVERALTNLAASDWIRIEDGTIHIRTSLGMSE